MKNLTILIFCLFCFETFAKTIEVDVLKTEIGIEDQNFNKTLCLTVVRVPHNGALLGLVEDIRDCFYARQANKSQDHKLRINLKNFKNLKADALAFHLQKIDTQLMFLFSEGE
jgi:hypothetical protein